MIKRIIIVISVLLVISVAAFIIIKEKSDIIIKEQKQNQRIEKIEFDDDEYEYDLEYDNSFNNESEENKMTENINENRTSEFDNNDDYEEESNKQIENQTVVIENKDEAEPGITVSTITDNKSETLLIPD